MQSIYLHKFHYLRETIYVDGFNDKGHLYKGVEFITLLEMLCSSRDKSFHLLLCMFASSDVIGRSISSQSRQLGNSSNKYHLSTFYTYM